MYPPPGKQQSSPREYFNGALLKFLNRRYEYANKNRGNAGLAFMRNFILVKPGLHIVITIAQYACSCVLTLGLYIVVMIVSTVANMFPALPQAILIHVNTLITTSQASPAL